MKTISILIILFLLSASSLFAQTTLIMPNGAGGWTVHTPNQMPTTVMPNGAGGWVVHQPMPITPPPPVYPPGYYSNPGGNMRNFNPYLNPYPYQH